MGPAADATDLAVSVRSLSKTYVSGCRSNKSTVLEDLNMTVPTGAVYGLLGPSGCGKTTLLRIILGRLKCDSGHVTTLGEKPGTSGHGVPGSMVGFMPQEIGLHNLLTIGETLNFFGRLHKMTEKKIKERKKFLLNFLQLPPEGRMIAKLSEGQKRRTSFATALLHEPELLILDEPTVGVDPVLRQKIWEYLTSLSTEHNVTTIITTHYIDEAARADVVGMMRHGHLLAEAPPALLMEIHRTACLEDVFLQLCVKEETGSDPSDPSLNQSMIVYTRTQGAEDTPLGNETQDLNAPLLNEDNFTQVHLSRSKKRKQLRSRDKVIGCATRYLPNFWILIALFLKNLSILSRNYGLILFAFFVAPLNICLFFLALGNQPMYIDMAVVNNDHSSPFPGFNLGKMVLAEVDNVTIIQNPFKTLEDAKESVRLGHNWGVMELRRNFSQDLISRVTKKPDKLSKEEMENGNLHLYLDMTNPSVDFMIQKAALDGFTRFAQKIVKLLHNFLPISSKTLALPVQTEPPIYGLPEPSMTNFIAPGTINVLLFFLSCALTSMIFINERKMGLLDRTLLANANVTEIILAHLSTQFLVLCLEIISFLIVTFAIFQIPCRGPFILLLMLCVLQGISGMMLGILVSILCDHENTAMYSIISLYFPLTLLSGVIWPRESLYPWLRVVSWFLPNTPVADAMRFIMLRGWGFAYPAVYTGFATCSGWILGELLLATIIFKIKHI